VALQDAGAAHTQLGRELSTVAAHLAQESSTLADNWSGPAARSALTQVQRLHEQTAALATQATETGTVLTWLGTQVIPTLQHPADPAQAHAYLTQLTADLIRADTSLPSHIGARGPVASATVPTSTGATASIIHPTRPKTPASTTRPTHPTTTVSSLQSAAPTPTPGTPTTTPAPNATPVASSTPSTPPAPTITTVSSDAVPAPVTSTAVASADPADTEAIAAYLPLAPSLPTGTTTSSSSQDAKDKGSQQTPTAQTASASTLTSPPFPAHTTTAPTTPGNGHFLPTTPSVTTQPTQERHRDSWTPEDRNLWGLPADCVPPVIAGA
jgi:hypothetical protein